MSARDNNNEMIDALVDAAYRGGLSRRRFMRGLIACGVAVAVARDMAEHAALAQANQAAQTANLRDEYDYVIVGAGSAGCVLANRLSQDGRSTVLVIEGGGTDIQQNKIVNPGLWGTNIGSDTDWGNKTVPQPNLANRVAPIPVGKIIGGGSSINATIWLRGDKADYDAWEAAAGPDWGFAPIAERFKKLEKFAGGANQYRGDAGPIFNRWSAPAHVVTRAFIDSAKEAGIAENLDLSGTPNTMGVGHMNQNFDENARRVSAANGFLMPALSRSNLTLLTATRVLRLDITGGQCRGVVANVQGQERRFAAAREVVLSAGAIHSPKLLMLSGVGPAAQLRQFGINVNVDAPAIGENLHDHLLLRVYFRSKDKMPARADTGVSGCANVKTSSSLAGPDVQIFSRHDAPLTQELKIDEGYTILPGITKPKSRGTLRLTSADPNAPLEINPNYLGEQADVDALVVAAEMGLAIGNGKGYADLRQDQVSLKGAGKAETIDYIRRIAATYFHYCGTVAMGRNASAPVDEALRLRGVSRLRVVDASVIPEIPSANTNPPTMIIADKAADLILAARG